MEGTIPADIVREKQQAQIEYDTEKWNAGLGLSPWAGLRLRTALLNGESLSLGAGWSLTL